MGNDTIAPILRMHIENANRPRSKKEDEAGRHFVLGRLTIAKYLAAPHTSTHE
jgi:hypothetical protein